MEIPTAEQILTASYALPSRPRLEEFDAVLEAAREFSDNVDSEGFDLWVRVGWLAHDVCGDDWAMLFALCERSGLCPHDFLGLEPGSEDGEEDPQI